MEKTYISPQQLLDDSLQLALQVLQSGFRPRMVLGVWRGGTPIAIAIQETLALAGHVCDHMAIRAMSYTGIAERAQVKVDGLDYVRQHLRPDDALLLVDDVLDTGLSIQQILREIKAFYPDSEGPEIRIATPYYKPSNNLTSQVPDYYLHTTADWLVFPHELLGLSRQELLEGKSAAQDTKQQLAALLANQAD